MVVRTEPGRVTRIALVTGANGFAGRAVVEQARRRGIAVRAAVRGSAHEREDGVVEHAVGDLASADWSAAVDGVDTVVHLAARVHRMREDSADPLGDYRRDNVDGTVRLARAAVAAGVRRLVFASTVKVLGDATAPGRPFDDSSAPEPRDPYSVSKLEAERALAAISLHGGLEVVVLRPVLMYGPGAKGNIDRLMRWIAAGVPLPLGGIDNRRSLLGVRNFADAVFAVADHASARGRCFLVADGEDLSTPELARRIGTAVGRPARLVAVPRSLMRTISHFSGGAAWQRLAGSLQVDASGLQSSVGWAAPFRIDEGLTEMIDAAGLLVMS
jgi:nucleoside-diphosphate-sugar epimerase